MNIDISTHMAGDFFIIIFLATDTDMHVAISTQIHSLSYALTKCLALAIKACEVNIHSLVTDRPLFQRLLYIPICHVWRYTSQHISACELAQLFLFS